MKSDHINIVNIKSSIKVYKNQFRAIFNFIKFAY